MSENPVIARVTALVMPILGDLGLDLYDMDFGAGLLKITVDKPGGVDLGVLSLVARLLNRELEHQDPLPGDYTLEVSSPGIERPLRRPDHYTRVIGATVNIRLRDVTSDSRRFEGTLVAADEVGITLRLDDAAGTARVVPYDHIDRARTVFVWGPPPKGARRPAAQKTPLSASTIQEVTTP